MDGGPDALQIRPSRQGTAPGFTLKHAGDAGNQRTETVCASLPDRPSPSTSEANDPRYLNPR